MTGGCNRGQYGPQSRLMSLLESITNVVVGFAVALATQAILFPLLGWHITTGDNLLVAAIFTVVSIARSFTLRRLFEALRARGTQKY